MTSEWSQSIMDRVGAELKRLRVAAQPSLSAQALSERTAQLGYPISRAVISDLETGRRRGLDVADLMVLAAALRVAPAQLLFPDLPRGVVEVLPDDDQESHDALRWFSGESGLLHPREGWTDASSGDEVAMTVRDEFAAELDRTSISREWLNAVSAMRSARSQLRNALVNNESREQIDALEFMQENARTHAESLAQKMSALGMNVGEGHPRA